MFNIIRVLYNHATVNFWFAMAWLAGSSIAVLIGMVIFIKPELTEWTATIEPNSLTLFFSFVTIMNFVIIIVPSHFKSKKLNER